jgi:Reverse transcriptase (RNA-dependent DNA polymerase)
MLLRHTGVALDLFRNYLTHRKQYVFCAGISSDKKNVALGVPQGSILGPLLFILYINDIVKCSSLLSFFLFADDTTLFHSNKNLSKLVAEMNDELNHLAVWFGTNKLSLNAGKTNFIVFGNKRLSSVDDCRITLDGNLLKRVQSAKFLGVHIDEKLMWSYHIKDICAKASRGIGILSRMKNIFPAGTLKLLYDTLIYPYLTYCCVMWGNAYMNVLNNIIVLQNKALRLITNSKYRASSGPLYAKLNLLRVIDIHRYQVLIFMYKARTNAIPESCLKHFEVNVLSVHNTRCSSYYKIFGFRTDIRKCAISIAGPRLWNTIPVTLQNSVSLSCFKKSLKLWLCSQFNLEC